MPTKTIVFALVTFLHDLFTAVWIGGLITLGLSVIPTAKKVLGKGPQTKKFVDAIQKRLSVLVYVSIVGLLLTGLLQANRSPAFQGLFNFWERLLDRIIFKAHPGPGDDRDRAVPEPGTGPPAQVIFAIHRETERRFAFYEHHPGDYGLTAQWFLRRARTVTAAGADVSI